MTERNVSFDIVIPSGLNRIKTQRVARKDHQLSSKPDNLTESRSHGAPRPPIKSRQKIVDQAQGKTEYKGKKLSKWFTSYMSKGSSHYFRDAALNMEDVNSEVKIAEKDESTSTKNSESSMYYAKVKIAEKEEFTSTKNLESSMYYAKIPRGLKSFSHELVPRGGIKFALPRAHSFNDLKEIFNSFRSKFDAAKVTVDSELDGFARDIMGVIKNIDASFPEQQKMAEDLLILAQSCVEMTSSQFRAECETIVQDLTLKRQQCQTGTVKWLFTLMLFILTRCTRLLMFQKESEPLNEKTIRKLKECLDGIPAVEMNWASDSPVVDSGSNHSLYQRIDFQKKSKRKDKATSLSKEQSEQSVPTSQKDSFPKQELISQTSAFENISERHNKERSVLDSGSGAMSEQQHTTKEPLFDQGSDSVICRICEEDVPISHLESHSYICAYADKCEQNCLDVDERLLKLEEILEQIVDSLNLSSFPAIGSPENSRILVTANPSESCSPKVNEWRYKGVEGMYEDLHEMDTAFIDDSYMNPINLKSHIGSKLWNNGASSSTGSATSVSSTNTPRTSHFDSFWLERSEQEDVQLMIDLADIARCAAGTDLSKEQSYEYLLACMQDLQDTLKRSKLKALVIDTFGGRIEKLLREKYILACDQVNGKSPPSHEKNNENARVSIDNASQSSSNSTSSYPLQRDRTSIDDFEMIKPISRGAFGKVFLARKRTTGDLFAIKVLKKLDMIRKNDVERILAERNILITVRNPFVVRFYYSFTCRDNLYLVMEYLNGGDLYSLLRKVGCLDEDVARIYVAELVLALEYLHSLGIVHRDLKPDNILIAHDGHIKLTDFGLSKIGLMNNTIDLSGRATDVSTQSGSTNLLQEGTDNMNQQSAVGTPDYLAPEILLGTENCYAADWWSVGIILFELITGIPPFTAEQPEIIFHNILNGKIPWPQVPGDLSYDAQDMINRFLDPDPNQRLGANGSAEVKLHPFFEGLNWDSIKLQEAPFVPQPDGVDDTGYFVSRYSQTSRREADNDKCSNSGSECSTSYTNSGDEMDECGRLEDFDSAPINLSLLNFSFKNLSQLASINHDVLLQTGKDPTKGSPYRGPGT